MISETRSVVQEATASDGFYQNRFDDTIPEDLS